MRRYRMTANGEEPVWASRSRLARMGQEWAEMHFRPWGGGEPTEPMPYGNVIHDAACARRWELLTGKLPSWFRAEGGAA